MSHTLTDPNTRFVPTDAETATQAQMAAIMLARGSEAQVAEALTWLATPFARSKGFDGTPRPAQANADGGTL